MYKKLGLTLATVFLLSCLIIAQFPQRYTVLAVDSYGDDINYIEVWEGDTLKANFTSGGTVKVNASKLIRFVVGIQFNDTLASSTAEAIDYTRVYMNITGIWTNMELNNTACQHSGSWYYLKEEGNLTANTLNEGETYECSVLYQGYY